jgi:LmbE family N-acetylglucosaminyl deacetylase
MFTVWFLFAHPDDEFAVTALIKDRCSAGDQVHCAYLTDGTFGGQSPSARRQETLPVLSRLGVDPDRVHFIGESYGFADGALCKYLGPAFVALMAMSAETGAPDTAFCPAWEGGHQDHDAVHLLALAVASELRGNMRLRQFSLYHGSGLPGPLFHVLSPLKANGPTEDRSSGWRDRFEQLRTAWSYPSQWRTWLGLLPFLTWHVLTDGRFRVQAVDRTRVLEPPHANAPLYERRGFMSYQEFRASTGQFIESHIPCDRSSQSSVSAAWLP